MLAVDINNVDGRSLHVLFVYMLCRPVRVSLSLSLSLSLSPLGWLFTDSLCVSVCLSLWLVIYRLSLCLSLSQPIADLAEDVIECMFWVL